MSITPRPALTLREMKGQTIDDVEIDEDIVKLKLSSGNTLLIPFFYLSVERPNTLPPDLQRFLQEMATRRKTDVLVGVSRNV